MDEQTVVLTSTVWPTASEVQLLQVPWDSKYRDVVAWESTASRDAWFEAHRSGNYFATNFQNLRPGEPIVVPVPYSTVYKYNYLTVHNPQQPVDLEGNARTYFYFITSAEYVSPQATRLTVQLDVMTTYTGTIEFGRAYVESGHVAMANASLNTDGGKPKNGQSLLKYMDLQEGIDCGSALVPVKREFYNALPVKEGKRPLIIVVTTANLAADPGTVSNPNLECAYGSVVDRLPGGCTVYVFEPDDFGVFTNSIHGASWVAQCIISIYSFPREFIKKDGLIPVDSLFGGRYKSGGGTYLFSENASVNMEDKENGYTTGDVFEAFKSGLGTDSDLTKLYAYPYSVIEMGSFSGNPIYLQPQYIRGNKVALKAIACALQPFAKVGVFPENYGTPSEDAGLSYVAATLEANTKAEYATYSGKISSGDFLDTAVWLTDFPQFSIVNNNYLTYMASTAHTRAYNYETAAWNRDRAGLQAKNAYLDANDTARMQYANAYGTSTTEKKNASLIAGAQSDASQSNWLFGSIGNIATGIGGGAVAGATAGAAAAGVGALPGAVAGGLLGAAGSTISAVTGQNAASNQQNIYDAQKQASIANANTNAANARRYMGAQTGNALRDYNTAIQVNNGDYKNAVAAINAATADAQLTPPSVVGQMGGEGFNWANGLVGVCITYKTVTGAAKESLSDYFRRYGYSVRRFLELGSVRDMLCMTKFAYWRILESNITCADANESERESMRGVMEKGTTLWAKPEYIGTTDVRTNAVRTDGHRYAF